MSLFAFKCENGKKGGVCPLLFREAISNIKPMEAPIEAKKQVRVLVVDDTPGVRRVVCRLLGGAKMEAASAEGHVSALAILEKDCKFDVVLLDFDMGGETGAELFWKLPEELRGKVLFFSGESDPRNLAKMAETGRPRLEKTAPPDELVARIKEIASQTS